MVYHEYEYIHSGVMMSMSEPASGRASKLWLRTARVVDIGYYGYGEPLGSAGEGHTGFRRDLARP